jgi:D-xylose transport system substrate-binding protein
MSGFCGWIFRSVAVVILFLFLAFVGSSSPVFRSRALAEPQKNRPKVCVLLPTLRENRWHGDLAAFRAAAAQRGNLDILIHISRNRSDVQAAQLDKLIAAQCDFYVIAAHDYRDMCRHLARYPNIRVVAYDRPLACAPVELFVGYNNLRVGALQGEFLAKAVPTGSILLLKGPASDGNSHAYFEGAQSILAPLKSKGAIRIAGVHEVRDWSPARGQAFVLAAWHKSKGNIDAILAPNDAIAEGVIETLKGLGVAGKVVVTGQDGEAEAIARIQAGTQAMTVRKDVAKLVTATLNAVSTLAAGTPIEPTSNLVFEGHNIRSILLEPEIITSTNWGDHR